MSKKGFFQSLTEDLSQAVNELMPEEEVQAEAVERAAAVPMDSYTTEDIPLEPVEREVIRKEEPVLASVVRPVMPSVQPKAVKTSVDDETATITSGMTITGNISSSGSLDVTGRIIGDIEILGKLSVTGTVQGNSKASEIYADSAKISGEVMSTGSVKIGQNCVIIGNVIATSAVVAGAIKGDIDVKGPVVLDTSAIVMGNIKSKSVQINNGAVIEGMCSQCYADVNPTSFFDDLK